MRSGWQVNAQVNALWMEGQCTLDGRSMHSGWQVKSGRTSQEFQASDIVQQAPSIAISDHIYLLDDGHIAWQGTGEELSGERHLMEVYLGA